VLLDRLESLELATLFGLLLIVRFLLDIAWFLLLDLAGGGTGVLLPEFLLLDVVLLGFLGGSFLGAVGGGRVTEPELTEGGPPLYVKGEVTPVPSRLDPVLTADPLPLLADPGLDWMDGVLRLVLLLLLLIRNRFLLLSLLFILGRVRPAR